MLAIRSQSNFRRVEPTPILRHAFSAIGMPLLCMAVLLLAGCSTQQNPQSYRDNIKLKNENASLRRQIHVQVRTIADLRRQLNSKTPAVASLPPKRLAEMFQLDHIAIGSGCRLMRFAPGRGSGFRVFVKTRMADGEPLPVGGRVVIEAFDLKAASGHRSLGRWEFGPSRVHNSWYGMFGLNQFAFDCPLKTPPLHHAITFHVVFNDALTGHVFTAQRVIKLGSLQPQ